MTQFISGTTLIHLKIRCWSGEKKANRDLDIKMGTDGKLPPQKLLDLGRKKIFPPEALSPLQALRKAAERVCLKTGTRFMGGFAVTDESVDEVIAGLDAVQLKFSQELSAFMDAFDEKKHAWLLEEENVEFAHILNDLSFDRDAVKSAFHFSFTPYKINSVEGFELSEEEIGNQILHELGQDCWTMAKGLIDRKTATSGKTLRSRLEPFVDRLNALSFGNSRILSVLDEFRALRDSIPLERIDKDHPKYGQTLTFLKMCSDSDTLERIIDGRFSVTQMINAMTQPAAPADQSMTDGQLATAPAIAASSRPASSVGAYF